MVYVREDLMLTRRGLGISSVEALWLEISLPKSRGFLVETFLRADCSSKYNDKDFMVKLNNMLDIIVAQRKELILLGVFNCCLISSTRNNTDCHQLKSLFRYSDLKQLITSPTRTSQDSKSFIDLIAARCPRNIRDSGVITSHLSDHEMIYCIRKLNWQRAPSQVKTFRNNANYNTVLFCQDLKGVWFNTSIPSGIVTNVDQLWQNSFRGLGYLSLL